MTSPLIRRSPPGLRAALQAYPAVAKDSPLAKFADTLRDRSGLRAARRDFEPSSTALADVAREQHLTHREGPHVSQCPMAPVLGIGNTHTVNTYTVRSETNWVRQTELFVESDVVTGLGFKLLGHVEFLGPFPRTSTATS